MWRLYDDFIYLLRAIAPRWPWVIDAEGSIRTLDDPGEEFDPITAACATLCHRALDLGSYRAAARALGLDLDTADIIAQAADRIGSYNAHVRADLIEALALDEPFALEGRWHDKAFRLGDYPHQYDKPFRRGASSAGTASVAGNRARWKCTNPPRITPLPLPQRVHIADPAAALWILSVSCAPTPASSSGFSVGTSRPGFVLTVDRMAAD